MMFQRTGEMIMAFQQIVYDMAEAAKQERVRVGIALGRVRPGPPKQAAPATKRHPTESLDILTPAWPEKRGNSH